jgi:hypothetical protein
MPEQKNEVRTKFSTLFLDPIVMKRIMYYAQAADGEVSGLGTIKKDEKGRYVVDNVYLLEQESSGADTELKPEAISKLMTDMIKENKDPALLKFWWHSHADMGVFWSGTDDTCAETLSHEFAFSLVVNKKGDTRCRLDLYNPFRITFDGVKVTELIQEDKNLKEECEKEVKEKVKSPHGNWSNWNEKDSYEDYYGYSGFHGYHHGPCGHHRSHYSNDHKPSDSKVKLDETTVKDIERLVDLAERYETEGGVFHIVTWNEYIHETLKEVVENRLTKRAACTAPLTFQPTYSDCKNGKCKVQTACAFWTKFFDETEQDAGPELIEYNKEKENMPILADGDTYE